MTHRFREQARSYKGCLPALMFEVDIDPCGSEPACEEASTNNIHVECIGQ